MAHTDLAQQTLAEHKMLTLLIEGLRNTLAWKVEGTDFSRKLSTLRFIAHSFQRHLERVLALEEYDGYMDLVVQARPQMGNSIAALRQEHDQFRNEACQIVHRFEHVSPTDGDSFSRICGELIEFLNKLDAHNKKEIDLMQEAFDQDEGGEG
jgi:hemerythrin-like domain-containing protein